jgi:hypothetical protein
MTAPPPTKTASECCRTHDDHQQETTGIRTAARSHEPNRSFVDGAAVVVDETYDEDPM